MLSKARGTEREDSLSHGQLQICDITDTWTPKIERIDRKRVIPDRESETRQVCDKVAESKVPSSWYLASDELNSSSNSFTHKYNGWWRFTIHHHWLHWISYSSFWLSPHKKDYRGPKRWHCGWQEILVWLTREELGNLGRSCDPQGFPGKWWMS